MDSLCPWGGPIIVVANKAIKMTFAECAAGFVEVVMPTMAFNTELQVQAETCSAAVLALMN